MLNDRLVAHRGYRKKYPENTLLAMQKAIEAGAHYIEMDIQFSADFHPVVYHDPLLKRVSDRDDIISSLSLSELIKVAAYEPGRLGQRFLSETISPLSDIVKLLAEHPNVRAFIELKTEAVEFLGIEKTFEVISKTLAPVIGQCILISFHYDFIQYAVDHGFAKAGMVLHNWEDISLPLASHLDYVFCDKKRIPQDAELNQYPFLLVVYEVDDPAEAQELFNRGADMIETFDIKGLLGELGHRAI